MIEILIHRTDRGSRLQDSVSASCHTAVRGSRSDRIAGSELFYAPADPGQEPRHVGTIEPLWNLFDLTRDGRPADWHEQFSY